MKTVASRNKGANSIPKEPYFPRLSQPALRALAGAGITSLRQLTGFRETEIKQLHGMGPRALAQLRQALADRGLSFADSNKK